MHLHSVRKYSALVKDFAIASPYIRDNIFDSLPYVTDERHANIIIQTSVRANLTDSVLRCVDGNDELAEEVILHTGASASSLFFDSNITGVPIPYYQQHCIITNIRHPLLNWTKRNILKVGECEPIRHLIELSGEVSDTQTRPLEVYFREHARSVCGEYNLPTPNIPEDNFDAVISSVCKFFPQLSKYAPAITNDAFVSTLEFTSTGAQLRFPVPEFYINRVPSIYLGRESFTRFRHELMRRAESLLFQIMGVA